MAFDIQKIVAAKKAHRHALASRDILEKLRMLDAMRERIITLRASAEIMAPVPVAEDAPRSTAGDDV